ncbi:MAG: RNA-binding protein [Lutimaribacter sp.]
MTRGGQNKTDGEDLRKCIVTGETAPRGGLVRFVVGPDGQVFPDIMEKLPGRGMWVSADRAAIQKAAAKGLFSRAAKAPVKASETLADDVEQQLVRRVVELISLARKCGEAVSGYEKVKDWLIKDYAEVLVQASDGSGRGKSKLSTPQEGSFVGWLTAEELGMAFGRQTVIHVALAAGGLASRVVEEAARLKGLRVSGGADATGKDRRRT